MKFRRTNDEPINQIFYNTGIKGIKDVINTYLYKFYLLDF